MNTTARTLTALGFALVMTLSMLGGIDRLAGTESGVSHPARLAQAAAPRA